MEATDQVPLSVDLEIPNMIPKNLIPKTKGIRQASDMISAKTPAAVTDAPAP